MRVWLPPGYNDPDNAKRKYPTLYLLDGQTAFDECTAFPRYYCERLKVMSATLRSRFNLTTAKGEYCSLLLANSKPMSLNRTTYPRSPASSGSVSVIGKCAQFIYARPKELLFAAMVTAVSFDL